MMLNRMRMTKHMKYSIVKFVMCALLVGALPAALCAQEWQSTSSFQGSGSAYTIQVTEVGAENVQQQATTTYDSPGAPVKKSPVLRKGDFGPGQDGGYQDPNSPIGDAWPLAVFAAMFAIVIAIKRHSINPKENN